MKILGIAALSVFGVVLAKPFAMFPIVSRAEWGARPPTFVEPMGGPVPYVVIHHSYIPGACTTQQQCEASMKSMQNMHQLTNGWNDIGYSFAVGGDGRAYMGRGWSAVGAHAPGYNGRSIGICVIGDWRNELPPQNQMQMVKNLVAYGVEMGYIDKNYKLLGHREVRNTECPGGALFEEVKRWRKLNTGQESGDNEDVNEISLR